MIAAFAFVVILGVMVVCVLLMWSLCVVAAHSDERRAELVEPEGVDE